MRSRWYFTPTALVRLDVALLDLWLDNRVQQVVISVAEDHVGDVLWFQAFPKVRGKIRVDRKSGL